MKVVDEVSDEAGAFELALSRLGVLLPERYDGFAPVASPSPMQSAGLKFRSDGTVAWDEIWGSFCELAMAGGPPHRGTLLEPGDALQIDKNLGRYGQVVDEICRGIGMVTGLDADRSQVMGWVRVDCRDEAMAGWLARAIVMENVAVHAERSLLYLPAGPEYRLGKEIKNVVTVIAKTCHYWRDHMSAARQGAVADLFVAMARRSPLLQPALPGFEFDREQHDALSSRMSEAIRSSTAYDVYVGRYGGWLGLECRSVPAAIERMRALAGGNICARREESVLFVPVNPVSDPGGDIVIEAVVRTERASSCAADRQT